MLYLWLKALHVAAVLVLLGGLVVLAVTVANLSRAGAKAQDQAHLALIEAVRRWDRRVTSPALGLVWILGITLAWRGGWFSAPWLMIKLAFAVFLSALHGMMSAMLRRAATGRPGSMPGFIRHAPAAIVVSAIAIAVLVVVKPLV